MCTPAWLLTPPGVENWRTSRVSPARSADTSASVEARQDLVRGVFGWKVDQATLDLLLAAVLQVAQAAASGSLTVIWP